MNKSEPDVPADSTPNSLLREREFALLFLDALRSRNVHDEDARLLLKALDMVSRFRFMPLDDGGGTSGGMIRLARADDLPGLARDLICELELSGLEARDAALHLADVWSRFVGRKGSPKADARD